MIRTFLFMVLWWINSAFGAVEINAYNTRLDIAPDGSATASVSLILAKGEPGRFRLPVGFAGLEAFAVQDVPSGVVLTPRPSLDQSSVEIDLPIDVSDDVVLAFTFKIPKLLFAPIPEEGQKSTLPDGSRLLRHNFVNTQAATIMKYQLQVRLPDETMVHMIREQLPKTKRKEFAPRVELDRFEGRQGALLQLANLKQGDRTSMELEVVGDRRSYGWLIAGLVLILGYLVSFRDLVNTDGR